MHYETNGITYPSTHWTSSGVLALIGGVLHAWCDKSMRAQQVPFETLIREESELTLLAIKWRPVVDHLWMNLDFVDPLHVVAELFEVFNVTVADLAYHKGIFGVVVARFGGARSRTGRIRQRWGGRWTG